jgi:methylenetetrahydrofolate dehydrogenase (NADP+)/methenyltetrahydrofolate cyclohydrolase
MANIIDGKKVSQEILLGLEEKISSFSSKPCLAIILVGSNPSSELYVKKKIAAAEKISILTRLYQLKEYSSERDIIKIITQLNEDSNIDGFIVQIPLPSHLNQENILEYISPEKDVDGLHPLNQGKLAKGITDGICPATPGGIIKLLDYYHLSLSGKNAVIIGRSNLVSKPLSYLLLQKDATVTITHSKTLNLSEHTKKADLLVSAVGKPNLVAADMVKPGAIVIDVGISKVDGKTKGDINFEEVKLVASHITPVPGGVGPMTIATLLENLVKIKEKNIRNSENSFTVPKD